MCACGVYPVSLVVGAVLCTCRVRSGGSEPRAPKGPGVVETERSVWSLFRCRIHSGVVLVGPTCQWFRPTPLFPIDPPSTVSGLPRPLDPWTHFTSDLGENVFK